MTILEGYFAQINDYPEDEVKLCVSRTYPSFVFKGRMIHFHSFAPSQELLDGYKAGEVTWEQYTDRFKDEMRRQTPSRKNLEWLKRREREGDAIRLMCYEKAEDRKCHRFILLDLLDSMEDK